MKVVKILDLGIDLDLFEMPQVILRNILNKYKVWFYDTEGNSKGINSFAEDKSIKNVHVHISRMKDYNTLAKLWVTETNVFPIKESDNYKCQLSNKELKLIKDLLLKNTTIIIDKWMNHFGFLNTHYQPTEQEKLDAKIIKKAKKSEMKKIKKEHNKNYRKRR